MIVSTDTGKTPHLVEEEHETGVITVWDDGWDSWKRKSLLEVNK